MNSSVQGHVGSGTLGFIDNWLETMISGDTRQQLRAKRRALSAEQQRLVREQLASILCNEGFFLRAKRIGIYLANDGEIDPGVILATALKAGKTCFLPVLHPLKKISCILGSMMRLPNWSKIALVFLSLFSTVPSSSPLEPGYYFYASGGI